jgi:hypothetical protein
MKMASFKEYAAQETERLLQGERLLAPEQVMERLVITRRQLQELHRGENPQGLFLPPYRLGKKTIRYRLSDVLRLEWAALQGEMVGGREG